MSLWSFFFAFSQLAPVHSCVPTVLPPARDLPDTQRLQEEARKPPSDIHQELERSQGRFGGWERGWGHPVVPGGFTAQRSLAPFPWRGGSKLWGWKGREGQRRREDKPVVICLFNWLESSEESCVVILALGLDRVQAPGFGPIVWAAEGGPGLLFTRRETGWEEQHVV